MYKYLLLVLSLIPIGSTLSQGWVEGGTLPTKSTYSTPTLCTSSPNQCWLASDANNYSSFLNDLRTAVIGVRSGIYNVKASAYGALGNGSNDDTAEIQAALTAAGNAGGGVVFVPPGTYMINATSAGTDCLSPREGGVNIPSNVHLLMSNGAIFKAITQSADLYNIVRIDGSNIRITGGIFQGERTTHTGGTGEHGFPLSICGASDVVIDGVIVKDAWGDGVIIDEIGGVRPRGIRIINSRFTNNRRLGLSIIRANGVQIDNSEFDSNTGTNPQAGIDIEPHNSGIAENIIISNSVFRNNRNGLEIYGGLGTIRHVSVVNSHFYNNSEWGIIFTGMGTDEIAVVADNYAYGNLVGGFGYSGTYNRVWTNNYNWNGSSLVLFVP